MLPNWIHLMLMLSLIPSIICFLSIDIVADTGSKPSKACSTVCLLVNSRVAKNVNGKLKKRIKREFLKKTQKTYKKR